MKQVAVVYFSQTGTTQKLADAVVSGLEATGEVTILVHRISGHEILEGRFINPDLFESLKRCDGIIMGTPTYMGGVAAQFKAFADASSDFWTEQAWANKVAAGFTCGSALNGDQSMSLQYLFTLASQQGMYWAGLDKPGLNGQEVNPLGCQMGVVAQANPDDPDALDLETAHYLGVRVGKLIKRLG